MWQAWSLFPRRRLMALERCFQRYPQQKDGKEIPADTPTAIIVEESDEEDIDGLPMDMY
jgi:hypothetical protein